MDHRQPPPQVQQSWTLPPPPSPQLSQDQSQAEQVSSQPPRTS